MPMSLVPAQPRRNPRNWPLFVYADQQAYYDSIDTSLDRELNRPSYQLRPVYAGSESEAGYTDYEDAYGDKQDYEVKYEDDTSDNDFSAGEDEYEGENGYGEGRNDEDDAGDYSQYSDETVDSEDRDEDEGSMAATVAHEAIAPTPVADQMRDVARISANGSTSDVLMSVVVSGSIKGDTLVSGAQTLPLSASGALPRPGRRTDTEARNIATSTGTTVNAHIEIPPLNHTPRRKQAVGVVKGTDRKKEETSKPIVRSSSNIKRPVVRAHNVQPSAVPTNLRRKAPESGLGAPKQAKKTAAAKVAPMYDSDEEAAQVEMKLEADDDDDDYVSTGRSATTQRPPKRRPPPCAEHQGRMPAPSKQRRVEAQTKPVKEEDAADDQEDNPQASLLQCKWADCAKTSSRRDLPQHVRDAHVQVPANYQGRHGRYNVVCLWADCPDRLNGAASHTVKLENLKKHIHSAMGTRYSCPVDECNKTFSRVWRLNDHIKYSHPGHGNVTSAQALRAD